MFLDEKLVEIGQSVNIENHEEVINAIRQMIGVCLDSLTANLKGYESLKTAKAQFKRIDYQWRVAALKLEKLGFGFINPDGFKIFVESKPEFKELL